MDERVSGRALSWRAFTRAVAEAEERSVRRITGIHLEAARALVPRRRGAKPLASASDTRTKGSSGEACW